MKVLLKPFDSEGFVCLLFLFIFGPRFKKLLDLERPEVK